MSRLILLGLAAITLTGCSLTGHLANFMLQATTKYAPLTPEHCKVYDYGLGRELMRAEYA